MYTMKRKDVTEILLLPIIISKETIRKGYPYLYSPQRFSPFALFPSNKIRLASWLKFTSTIFLRNRPTFTNSHHPIRQQCVEILGGNFRSFSIPFERPVAREIRVDLRANYSSLFVAGAFARAPRTGPRPKPRSGNCNVSGRPSSRESN